MPPPGVIRLKKNLNVVEFMPQFLIGLFQIEFPGVCWIDLVSFDQMDQQIKN